jgi:Beta-L-arabinofuranosidase, GH127
MKWSMQPRVYAFDRRNFIKGSLGALIGSSLAEAFGQQQNSQSTDQDFFHSYGQVRPNDNHTKYVVEYIRANAPDFSIPPYRGAQYSDSVPDTLDIAERAKLGIHVLTSITDPRADDEIYWLVDFSRNPPVMLHDFNDWVTNCEGLMEALPLLRQATGSSLNDHVDRVWMTSLLRSIGPDGLIYLPMKGRPWSRINAAVTYLEPVWATSGRKLSIGDASIAQIATPVTCQRMISTMTVYYLRDGNAMWKSAIEQMIQRLSAFAVMQDDYAYMPAGSVEPNVSYYPGIMPVGFMAEETSARLIQGLAQYYRVSGYEPARDLAAKLTRYIRYHAQYYETDGPPLVGPDERVWFKAYNIANVRNGGHGHAHCVGLVSILEYAATVNDRDTLAFVRSAYEWCRANGSSQTGFFPEIFVPGYDRCEADTIADMIAMALKLSLAGAGDYWDDADRWARNHFSESQLIDPKWVHRLAERSPAKPVAPNETSDGVAERNVGAFAGWSTGNDWVVWSKSHTYSIQHCCSGNSCRTLYYLWQHILNFQDGSLRVNLLLNRASPWCDVYSYIPYEGRVDLKIKSSCEQTLIRIPEWVASGSKEVTCQVNGRPRPLQWQQRHVVLERTRPGDTITIKFPIQEYTRHETIGGVAYTLQIRGNTVISIDPPGQNGPLYERAYYRDAVRWRKVDRFVPEQAITW